MRADMTKLIGAFHGHANAPKKPPSQHTDGISKPMIATQIWLATKVLRQASSHPVDALI
jgi:hypothetical protein